MTDGPDSATPTRLGGRGAGAPRGPSSDSIDAGRFIPGAMLAGRYRIVGLLGRGGMGEVYRADDLKLGQPVALKFLPEDLSGNPGSLERFFGEVRLARQIAHPHVCRVYDIAEADGHHFLSMEYVDGEDLASLLRRIGRLPQDKAIQIARQLCAGLSAAHDRGVLHRDLKPANVMIDGRGRARITDFGLAAAATAGISGAAARAGTPGYMAPEQMAGGTVTERTDVYALGLVLYELFTGKAAFEGSTLPDLAKRQAAAPPSSPRSLVSELEPAVERAILRCLDPDPAGRPASARAVASALPGGDPLAAALEAGETPSPEMVAEAGGVGALRPSVAWSCLIFVVLSLALVVARSSHDRVLAMIPLPEPPDSQVSRARQILRAIDPGSRPADATSGYLPDDTIRRALELTPGSVELSGIPGRAAREEINSVRFWYRESPRAIIRVDHAVGARWNDPPHNLPGMAGVILDQRGRLRELLRVPPERLPVAAARTEAAWEPLFEAAGLDRQAFGPVPTEAVPPLFADTRQSWVGPGSGTLKGRDVRVDGASLAGAPVVFRVVEADSVSPGQQEPAGSAPGDAFQIGVLIAALVSGAFLAVRNLAAGRGDTRAAFKVGIVLLVARLLAWLLQGHHVLAAEAADDLIMSVAFALYAFGVGWLFYVALEPHLRRHWPRILSSWARLIEGRWRDPLIGRDLLLGVVLACGIAICVLSVNWLRQRLAIPGAGFGAMEDLERQMVGLMGGRMLLGNLAWILRAAILDTFQLLVVMLVLKVILRREWLAWMGTTLVLLALIGIPEASLDSLILIISVALFTFCLQRFGLVMAMTARFTIDCLAQYPITSDFSAWYAYGGFLAILLVAGIAIYGFQRSLGGQPAFGRLLAEV